MRRPAVVCAVLVVAAVAGPAGAHAPPADAEFDPATDVRMTFDVGVAGDRGALRVTARAAIPSNVEQFAYTPPPGATVLDAEGFDRRDERYRWDGRTEAPTVTYRVAGGDGAPRGGVAVGDDWAVFQKRTVAGTGEWLYAGEEPESHHRFRSADGTPAYVGRGIVLVGEHETVAATGAGDRFRLVVPEAATLRADPAAVFDALSFARGRLDVGHDHETVTGVVFATRLRNLGFAPRGEPEFAVHEGQRPRGADNVWLHEYVHTRQGFEPEPELEWLVEGSAEYEAALLSLQHGTATWEEFRAAATTERYADADLSEPASGPAPRSHYEKGAAVVAALDAEIRRATGGERTFEDVFRRLNERGGTISRGEFVLVAERVAGESLDREVDAMVAGEFAGSPPADPYRYATGPEADDDGDGLTTSEEREAGTNPFAADTDDDGLADAAEVRERGTDPAVADTDGDGIDDGSEVARGRDPTAASTPSPTGGAGVGIGSVETSPTATATPTADRTTTPATTDGGAAPVGLGAILAALLLSGVGARFRRRR